jgi:proteasome lid subunit RPN8/RPN11
MPDKLRIMIDKRVLKGFIRRALKAYPKEYAEAVWGNIEDSTINIKVLQDLEHEATRDSITYDAAVMNRSKQEASDFGMAFLGDIHTHPDTYDASPSEDDWDDSASNKQIILGICSIWKLKSGRRRTRTRFWPRPPEHEMEITFKELKNEGEHRGTPPGEALPSGGL